MGSMVILRMVVHLRMQLGTAPPAGSTVTGAVSIAVMSVILTIVIVGAVLLARAARRSAMGDSHSGGSHRPHAGRSRRDGDAPRDAWTEAGRRMPVPPPEEERS